MSFILRLFSIVGLLFIFSCEEDVEEVTISDYHLFTATFEEGGVDDDVTSFIFISDGEGKILADSSFTGAASIELFADTNGSPPPDKIGVTILTKRDGQDFDIRTNLGVNKGSDWTWYHPYHEPEVIGQSYYMFTNLPDNLEEVIISSNGHRRNIDYQYELSTGGIWSLSHYEPIEDVLIFATLNNDSAIYTFVNDVSAGDTSSLDFSSFSGANQKIIDNNSDLDIRGYVLYGFDLNDSFIHYKRHRLGGSYYNSNGDLVYPYPSELEKFISWLWGGDSWGTAGGKQWSQRIAGEIPVSFEKIDADISVINSNINNFEVNLNGSFDRWYMFLELNDL